MGQIVYCRKIESVVESKSSDLRCWTGTVQYEEFECPDPKRVPLSHDHFIKKLNDVRSKLKTANEEVSKLLETVKEQDLVIKEKTSLIRSSSKKIVDLQRQVQQLGKHKYE